MGRKNVNVVVGGPVQSDYPKVYQTVYIKPNIPFALQVTEPNTKYVIKHKIDLEGKGGKTGSINFINSQTYDIGGVTYYYMPFTANGKPYTLLDDSCVFITSDWTGLSARTITPEEGTLFMIGSVRGGFHTDAYFNGDVNTMPENSILVFDGGSLDKGIISGTYTSIEASESEEIFGKDILIMGTWNVAEIYDTWFVYTENMVSNKLITNMLNLTAEDIHNKVLFTRNTSYHVEFTPPEAWCVEHPLWVTTGQLRDKSSSAYVPLYDEHGDPVYGDGSQTADDLYWTQQGTTRSIAKHLSTYYYPDPQNGPQNIYQQYFHDYGGIIWDPEVINAITLFFIKSNTHLVIDSTIQMLNHKQACYNFFNMINKHDITIEGSGKILGEITDNYDITYKWPVGSHIKADPYDGKWHMYYGEFGVLVNMLGASDVVIRDIVLSGSSGDCLYINPCISECPAGKAPSLTRNVLVENVTIDKARRNGIVCCGINVTLNDVLFSNCGIESIGGTAPRSGIDFENDVLHPMLVQEPPLTEVKKIVDTYYPDNYNAMGCINVRMNNCKFENNFNDISATSTQVDQSKINPGDPSNLTPGAAVVSNCNIRRLRLNWTNSLRFRNCQIDNMTSYDKTIDPELLCEGVEYENCRFGDNLAPTYFAYQNKTRVDKSPAVRFDNCVGSTMFCGKNYAMYRYLSDSIVNVKIPFTYDPELEWTEFPYKIHRGTIHVKIVHYSHDFSLRITECDILTHDFPKIRNMKCYGDIAGSMDYDYISICSEPLVIEENGIRYISFYIAGGDVLNRYYNYDTKQFSPTPSGERSYADKDVLITFDYMGVSDDRNNMIVSVQTGWLEQSLEDKVFSKMIILCNEIGIADISEANGFEFNWYNYMGHIASPDDLNRYTELWTPKVMAPRYEALEYITRFPKLMVNTENGIMPVGENTYIEDERDVIGGLVGNKLGLTYNIFHSSRFGYLLHNQGNLSVKADTSYVKLQKAMTKAELNAKILTTENITFESGQQVFITDEGTNGKLCCLFYDKIDLTTWIYLNIDDTEPVITQDDTIIIYAFGHCLYVPVTAGDTPVNFAEKLYDAMTESFAAELVDDITAPVDPSDVQKMVVGRMQLTRRENGSVVYVKYANADNVFNYSGGAYILAAKDKGTLNLTAVTKLDPGCTIRVIDAMGNIVNMNE